MRIRRRWVCSVVELVSRTCVGRKVTPPAEAGLEMGWYNLHRARRTWYCELLRILDTQETTLASPVAWQVIVVPTKKIGFVGSILTECT